MVIAGKETYFGDYFAMYTSVGLPSDTSEANIMLSNIPQLKKKKEKQKENLPNIFYKYFYQWLVYKNNLCSSEN